MTPRRGLVVELRFEMDGHLVQAFVPPLIPADGSRPLPPEVYWYVQFDHGSAFRGPPYGVYPVGQESVAEAEIRRFLTDAPPRAGAPAGP